MAKEKRSASDLDAELAALEAELAALEKRPKKGKSKAAAPAPAPAAPVDAPEPDAAPEEAAPAKKGRFSLPFKLGKKADGPAPAPQSEPAPEPAAPAESDASPAPALSQAESTPPAPAPSAADAMDLSNWGRDGDAWVRTVRETPVPVVRRVLDEEGNLLREERATQSDVDDARGVKAERGLGRFLRRK